MIEGSWPTPLLRLRSFEPNNVWAKLEFMNPITHSIKDRTALALARGLNHGSRAIEASSGNLAVALASILRRRGVEFVSYIPKSSPRVFKVMLRLLGVEVVERDGSTISMLPEVERRARDEGLMHPNQFSNPANYMIHYEATAREIDMQVKAAGFRLKYVVASMGTAGHLTGISMYFKGKYGDSVKVIGVQPARGSKIPGIKRIDEGYNPFRELLRVDEVVDVTLEQALIGVVKVARGDGILVGLSSGAVAYAAYKLGLSDAVLVFPDDAWKYAYELDELGI